MRDFRTLTEGNGGQCEFVWPRLEVTRKSHFKVTGASYFLRYWRLWCLVALILCLFFNSSCSQVVYTYQIIRLFAFRQVRRKTDEQMTKAGSWAVDNWTDGMEVDRKTADGQSLRKRGTCSKLGGWKKQGECQTLRLNLHTWDKRQKNWSDLEILCPHYQ